MYENIKIFSVKNEWLHKIEENYEGISFVKYKKFPNQKHEFCFFGATSDDKPVAFVNALYFVAETGIAGWSLSACFSKNASVKEIVLVCYKFLIDFIGIHMPIYVLISRKHTNRKNFINFAKHFGFQYKEHYDKEFDIYIKGSFCLEEGE